MKSRYLVSILMLAAFAMMLGQPAPARAGGDIKPPAGTFAATYQGSFVTCFNPDGSGTVESCRKSDAVAIPFRSLDTGTVTFDGKSNACSVNVEVTSFLPLNSLFPGQVANSLWAAPPALLVKHEHEMDKVVDYDPATGTGDMDSVVYTGDKASCNGAILEPNGETHGGTIHQHFVVSDDGNRIDLLFTDITNPSGGEGGGFIEMNGFAIRQTSQDSQGQ